MIRLSLGFLFLVMVTAQIICTSCDELIKIDDPKTQLSRKAVFDDDLTATAALSGLYGSVSVSSGSYVSLMASLSADETSVVGSPEDEFYQNAILSGNDKVLAFWQTSYGSIYQANSIIEGLTNSSKITDSLKSQLLGESLFLRSFVYFYLINIFGDVPYLTNTNYEENGIAYRTPILNIYTSIIDDLKQAKLLLADDYSFSNGERVRANKWVATALLARVYLYTKDWVQAEEQASVLIVNPLYGLEADLDKVFRKNGKEAILQLIPGNSQRYTNEGFIFLKPVKGSPELTSSLVNSFKPNDMRLSKWIAQSTVPYNLHYAIKYKENYSNATGAEYSMIFRLAEQFLIRAEARAKQDKLTGFNSAESDINTIRKRAYLSDTVFVDKADLLLGIEEERRKEFFTEWGHRWLDLKRTGRASDVLGKLKADWDETDVLYPIPYKERLLNPHLTPNPGY